MGEQSSPLAFYLVLRTNLWLGFFSLGLGLWLLATQPIVGYIVLIASPFLVFSWLHIERLHHMEKFGRERSQLLQSEWEVTSEKYANILKSMSSGVMVLDVENRFTHVNQTALSIFSAKEEELIGKQIFQIPEFTEVSRLLARTLDTVPPYFHNISQAEVFVSRLDGSEIPLGLSTTVLLDKQDYLSGYLVICQDLTEIKSLRERAERDKRLAYLGEMAAGVAHEIRNPLASVMGFVSVMDEELNEKHPHRNYINIIMSEIDRTSRVIQEILDFSRQAKLSREPHNLNSQIQNLLFQMSPRMKEKSIVVYSSFCPEANLVQFDSDQIQQVMLNMVQNAIDAMEKGGRLTVNTLFEEDPHGPGSIRLEIMDTGCGIPRELIEKVFEPFYTNKKQGQGTGLGLSISSRIIADHGGTIEVQSEQGNGTTFVIRLPIEHN